jgi:pimeloyl-ACP methyl ester carboxylesterase
MYKTLTTHDGFKINYAVYGKKENPAVFFVTGIGGNSAVWTDFIELFDKDYYVIANDFRGFGGSDRPDKLEHYQVEHFIEDLNLIIDEEGNKPVNLLGHCFGGTVVINYAKKYPEKINKLVLIETSNENSRLAKTFTKITPLMSAFKYLVKAMPKWHKKGYQDFTKYRGSWDLDPIHISNDMMHSSVFSYLATLYNYLDYKGDTNYKIEIPSLLIGGKKDLVYPLKQMYKLRQIFTNHQFIEIDDNHLLPVNRPEELMVIIKKFLDS